MLISTRLSVRGVRQDAVVSGSVKRVTGTCRGEVDMCNHWKAFHANNKQLDCDQANQEECDQ